MPPWSLSVLHVNLRSPIFWENTKALFVRGVAGPVERHWNEVPAGGKRPAGDPDVAQPQRITEVFVADI